jgi:putative transposase
MAAADARTIFAQPDAASVRSQLHVVAGMLGSKFPKAGAMLLDSTDDLTAFADFPAEHWRKIWSTDENVNRGVRPGCARGLAAPAAAA